MSELVQIAKIVAAHGIRGRVKIQLFADDATLLSGDGLCGLRHSSVPNIKSFSNSGRGFVIAEVEGSTDRSYAEGLVGTIYCIKRDSLPEIEDSDAFYYCDFAGMELFLSDGGLYGKVKSVMDFGAGDIAEVSLQCGGDVMLPIAKDVFREINWSERRAVVYPPEYAIN